MCLSDEIAYALIKNLYSCGLRVPDDLIVTGFDNAPCASNTAVSITTIAAETEHCGREAVSTLHALINKTEPEIIKPPKLKVITGESCGCGTNKKLNIRSQLDKLQKNETVNMEFRNSRFEEIYRIRTLKQLSFFVKNHKYLIRDQISVGVNLMGKDDDEALCIYLKDYFVNGESGYFRAADIYPDDFSFMRSKIWLSFYKLGRNRINDANMAACYAQNSISKIITAKPEDFEVFEIFTPISY